MQLGMATSTPSYFLFPHLSFSSSYTLAFQTPELIWTLESLQSRVFFSDYANTQQSDCQIYSQILRVLLQLGNKYILAI